MIKILIAFHSRNGSTETLANAVADGARSEGGEVRLRRAREVVSEQLMSKAEGWIEAARAMNAKYEAPTEADAEWADAIIFGSPTRFGAVASELKAYIDSLGGLWYPPMAHLGMIIVPLGYGDPLIFKTGTPHGASSVSGQTNAHPTIDDLKVAYHQGQRVAKIAKALTAAHLAYS